MIQLTINGKSHELDVDEDMPLLWAIRDHIGLTGTKYSCGVALCGACTIHLDGAAVRSCITPVSAAHGKQIVTIEGLQSKIGKAVQAAWQDLSVPQCGFCQSGQIMSAVGLLSRNPHPSDQEITDAMSGNICRCNTYGRIHAAVKAAAKALT